MTRKKGTAEKIRKLYEEAGRQLGDASEEEEKYYRYLNAGHLEVATACLSAINAHINQAKRFARQARELERSQRSR